jgi:radical SAM enzyme (rSAM/lipoprotein system)
MNLRARLRRRLLPAAQKAASDIHELRCIFFEITRRCNLACLHCGSDCTADSRADDLPAGSVLKVLDEIRSKYDPHRIIVVLSGGEPLCYPRIFDLGKEISAREFPWGMVTNGYAWTPETIQAARAANMASITVSLDGLEEDHDWLRGRKGSFRRAARAIELLVRNPCYRKMDVVTCVNHRNLARVNELYELVKQLGVTNWRIFTISPIGRAADNPELLLGGAELRRLLETIRELRGRNEIAVSYSESGYLGPEFEGVVRDRPFFCQAGISVAGIMIDGDILACPNIDRRYAQGNIADDSFVDVWEHRYRIFRDRSWMKQGDCAGCPEWRFCRGNSFHLYDPESSRTRLCYRRLLG